MFQIGQHFSADPHSIHKIVAECEPKSFTGVIEEIDVEIHVVTNKYRIPSKLAKFLNNVRRIGSLKQLLIFYASQVLNVV